MTECDHSFSADDGSLRQAEFRALEKQYAGLVFSVALRSLGCRQAAQEVTQDVFVLLARKSRGVEAGKECGWLHRAAVLKARERRRAESRYRRRVAEYGQSHPEPQAQMHSGAETEMDQLLERLDEALERLPERDRRLLFLRYFEGLDARAMAARLGITPGAAQKQCERARSRLAGKLAMTGVLAASVLRAESGAGANAVVSFRPVAAGTAGTVRGSRWKNWPCIAGLGAAAGMAAGLLLLPAPRAEEDSRAVGAVHASAAGAGAQAGQREFIAGRRQGPRVTAVAPLDLAALAGLLERADEGDSAADAAATAMLAAQDVDCLSRAATSVPGLALPVNRLRVLALGLLRHLVTRDARAAVLAGEGFWLAQHGASAPMIAGLVNEALARWAQEDRAAAMRWYAGAVAGGLFEDRGGSTPEPEGPPPAGFQRALELERGARDQTARVALARRLLLAREPDNGGESAAAWQEMADVWACKLPPAEARLLADVLWMQEDLPAAAVFTFRLTLVTLPTVPPSLESLRWAATPHGEAEMDAGLAAAVAGAWHQRHPAAAAAWLAALEGLPERDFLLSAARDHPQFSPQPTP